MPSVPAVLLIAFARVLEALEREEFLEHLPDGRYRAIGSHRSGP